MDIKQARPNKQEQKTQAAAMVNTPLSLPFDEETEAACLGAIIVNPHYWYDASQYLVPDDFYMLRNRYVYQAMAALVERKSPIDNITLANELKAMDKLNDIGGAAYIMNLMNSAPDSTLSVVYAQIVRNYAIRRQFVEYGENVKRLAVDGSLQLSDVVAKLEDQQVNIVSRFTGENTHKLGAAYAAHYERTETLVNNPGGKIGIPTGYHELDRLMLGLQPQKLTLIGARPAMGKTSLMLNLALHVGQAGFRVGYFSMEMGVDELVNRFAAMEAGIDTLRLTSGNINADEWARYVKVSGEQSKLPIYIDDTTTWTPPQLHAKCVSMQRRHGIDVVFIDYAGLMSGGGRYRDNRVAESGFISRSLKGLARDLRIPVVSAVQLSRKCEERADKRPMLSDLRDSGEWEQDADNVLFIYRDEVYNPETAQPGAAEIIIAKQRGGPIGTANLYFEKAHTRFLNATVRSIDI